MLPDALTTPSDEGQAPATSDNRTADQLLDAAASAGTTVDKPSATNLHDIPGYREVQSKYDKRIADQARRIAELEAAQEEAQLEGMDDVDRLKFERDKYARQLQEREQAEAIQQQKRTILSELSDKSGVPIEVLSSADSAYDAALLAVEYLKKGGSERREASKVDLGGGRANTPADRIETAAREAFANRDASAYIRLLREAQG